MFVGESQEELKSPGKNDKITEQGAAYKKKEERKIIGSINRFSRSYKPGTTNI